MNLALEIKEAWCTAPSREGLGGIASALVHVQRALRSCSKENFGAVTKELEGLRGRLESLQEDPQTSRLEIRKLTDRMDELLYREEMMWLQHPVLPGSGKAIETPGISIGRRCGGPGKIRSPS